MNGTKSAFQSKVNWTQIVAFLAMALAMFGIDMSPDMQAAVAVCLSGLAGLVTMIWRTWFTNKKLITSDKKMIT